MKKNTRDSGAAAMTHRQWKAARQFWKDGRKAFRMEYDLLEEGQRARFRSRLDALKAALDRWDPGETDRAVEDLQEILHEVLPPKRRSGIREHADIILVALVVAMAIRTFFIQPFKIPTGSMQPTLWGEFPPQYVKTPVDLGPPPFPLLRPVEFLLYARSFGAKRYIHGDHVFVDKISYNFRRPRRGEIIVFDTLNIPGIERKFFIKRLAGLPGETVGIRAGRLIIDGEAVRDPIFEAIYGVGGYVNDPRTPFGNADFRWRIPDDQFFALGDNSMISQDSRFWKGVPRENLIGRAFWVYWPFFRKRAQLCRWNPEHFYNPPEPLPEGTDLWFGPPRPRPWMKEYAKPAHEIRRPHGPLQ